jgi:hypothetical protein
LGAAATFEVSALLEEQLAAVLEENKQLVPENKQHVVAYAKLEGKLELLQQLMEQQAKS